MERSLSCEFPMKTATFTVTTKLCKILLKNKQWPVDGFKYTREDHVSKKSQNKHGRRGKKHVK